MLAGLSELRRWLVAQAEGVGGSAAESPTELIAACDAFEHASPVGLNFVLAGPTGERNTWRALPRDAVLCIAGDAVDRLFLLAAVLACGSNAVWEDDAVSAELIGRLPESLRRRVTVVADPARFPKVDAALMMAGRDAVVQWSLRLAARNGPIVGLLAGPPGTRDPARWPPDRLLVERTLSVNTAAAGGNASLMTM
jgi:RHH-type proline utilization regulon transcriptional repressor/proline dehydrogenase/delta 1-pyrroline-5-carboxylate dehydrogenase